MPLRPIDAIFVHPERRLYVVYYRGELWELPRMKIDANSWQRRQPYDGPANALYLSSHQAISDPEVAQKLRTLNLPLAIRGCTLPRFEAWWKVHGFEWLKDKLTTGQSPLAAHHAADPMPMKTANNQSASQPNHKPDHPNSDNITSSPDGNINMSTDKGTHINKHASNDQIITEAANTDIFADMLADLADEVLNHQL